MGRGKLPLELIENQKARKLAMEKRKTNLKKKAYELSTLCNVPVCVIMFHPDGRPDSEPPLLYPENRDEAQSIIDRYFATPKDGNCSKRMLHLEDLVVQGDTKRRRVDDSTSNCPNFEGLSRDHLCDMLSVLDQKLQFVQNRIVEFGNYLNHGQISNGFDPGFGYMVPQNSDQQLGFWVAGGNCFHQQQEPEQELASLADENAMLYSGSQICSGDQQFLLSSSSSEWGAVAGFHGSGNYLF